MLTWYGNQGGSESEPLSTGVGLNMRIQYWYDLDKKRVNEGYVVSNEINVNQPHSPVCGATFTQSLDRIEGWGRC